MASLLLSNLRKQPFPLVPLFSQASYCQLPSIRSLPAQIEQAEHASSTNLFSWSRFQTAVSSWGGPRERRQIEPKFVGDFSNVFNV